MKKLTIDDSWPDSWKYSYPYDLEEIYGEITNKGYAYAYQNRRIKTLELVKQVLPKGKRILDIAAAQGNFSLELAEAGYKIVWNDLRTDLADYVRLKYEYGDIEFAPGNVFDLGFESEFDCVLITEIIEHVAHPDNFLCKIAAMVKQGGYVVMTTPNGAYFRNTYPKFSECQDPSIFELAQFGPNSDDHIFLLWPDEIEIIAEKAGLIVDKLSFFTNPLTNGHIKLGTLLSILPREWVYNIEHLTNKLPQNLSTKFMIQTGVRYKKV